MDQPTLAASRFTRRAVLGAGAAAAAGTLMGRPAAAQQSLLWYSASASGADEEWSKMFKAKTGVAVEYFRIGGVKLTERIEQEVRARQLRFSVMDISIPGLMSQWSRTGMLAQYDSPESAHYPAATRLAGYWTPINALTLSMAYNADSIRPEEAPKTWEDLLNPKWKGRMTMSDALYSGAALQWYAALRSVYGKSFMEKLAKQDILVRNGSGETTDTIISGERPLAAMLLDYYVVAAIGKGANLYLVQPEEGIPAIRGDRAAGRGTQSRSGQEVCRLRAVARGAGGLGGEVRHGLAARRHHAGEGRARPPPHPQHQADGEFGRGHGQVLPPAARAAGRVDQPVQVKVRARPAYQYHFPYGHCHAPRKRGIQ